MIQRLIKLPRTNSAFLFGPRQTGKSTLVRSLMQPNDLYINLLIQKEYLAYSKDLNRFRQEVLTHIKKNKNAWIIIDEIQRIPDLLNEVHELI